MDFSLKHKAEIEGSGWIEFNISGTEDSYNHWADDSRFLAEDAFQFYIDIFEKCSDRFNYFGDSYFDNVQLTTIKQEIEARTRQQDSLPKQDNSRANDIKKLGLELVSLIDDCLEHYKHLWILGL